MGRIALVMIATLIHVRIRLGRLVPQPSVRANHLLKPAIAATPELRQPREPALPAARARFAARQMVVLSELALELARLVRAVQFKLLIAPIYRI